MRYLVTGGAGFIGSHLVDTLIEQGHTVVVIDNLSTGKKEHVNPKADFYQLDICNFDAIKPLFRGIDYAFHLAAVPRVSVSVKDPVNTSKVNIMGTINVFKAAIDKKVKRVVFASSAAVYGDHGKKTFHESTKPNPVSPYGLQKLVGEQIATLFSHLYGIEIICLRYFNVYGPRTDFDSDYGLVIGRFLQQKSKNKPLTIFDDGKQTRGFCYINDVIEATIKAMKSNALKGGEVINISRKESYSINYLSNLIGGNVVYLPKRVGDPLYIKADITLAKKLLHWEPKYNLKRGLSLTVDWFKKNYAQ